MSLKIRSILVLVVGTVLGLTVSFGGTVMAERDISGDVPGSGGLSPEYLDMLTRVVQRVSAEYVDPIDERLIVESAIRGILEELDSHSKYLPPDDYEDVRISTTGNYSGVGLDIDTKSGKVLVVNPLEGAPAAKAGILRGDVVVSVDDIPVDNKDLTATVSRMRGQVGTVVTLDIVREGVEEPLQFALTRADIEVRTVRGELLDEGVGYLRLSSFSNKTAGDLERTAADLRRQAGGELRGLVLDLRNNPGGVLDAAVDVADLFLEEGMIVRGSGRARQGRFERFAHAGDWLESLPVVVLVNSGSASASEIVAGALKDHGRARLVGTRTYGKGSVQTVMPLGKGSAIKLTTSLYITPSGLSINGIGIEPDYVVTSEDPNQRYTGPGSAAAFLDDDQLREALGVMGFGSITDFDTIAVSQTRPQ